MDEQRRLLENNLKRWPFDDGIDGIGEVSDNDGNDMMENKSGKVEDGKDHGKNLKRWQFVAIVMTRIDMMEKER